MNELNIEETLHTPEVHFNGAKGTFMIQGKSFPENVNTFYQPLFDYVVEYSKTPQPTTIFTFNWLYYNTATTKMMVKLLMKLGELNTHLTINWKCSTKNSAMIERGEELKAALNMPFNIVVD